MLRQKLTGRSVFKATLAILVSWTVLKFALFTEGVAVPPSMTQLVLFIGVTSFLYSLSVAAEEGSKKKGL